ncbi:hypothetical protein N9084_01855 [Flavobacteriales bacterium]|jgi:hypothetical protein|nr:hypothetical protein [Flavobacteriales bacterium]
MDTPHSSNSVIPHQLVRYAILMFWSIFWLFNLLDKVIGGAHFLWVGRDRFAQFQKYFASTGLDSPHIANAALAVAGALEAFAFVFFAGALIFEIQKSRETARRWCFIGTLLTLATFTFFSLGDHWFGDRFELLEHTLFWFISLASYLVFTHLNETDQGEAGEAWPRRQVTTAAVVSTVLVIATSTAIFQHNTTDFQLRSAPVTAEEVGENIYKVAFPFLGGSTVFERSLAQFKENHPRKTIQHIYTVPKPLRLKKADALIFYIMTEDQP